MGVLSYQRRSSQHPGPEGFGGSLVPLLAWPSPRNAGIPRELLPSHRLASVIGWGLMESKAPQPFSRKSSRKEKIPRAAPGLKRWELNLAPLHHHLHDAPWKGAQLEVGQAPGTLAEATYPHLRFSSCQTQTGLGGLASSGEGEELRG